MNCWHCGTELVWGGDHDIEGEEEYDMVTNLSCPNCGSYVEVYRFNASVEAPKTKPLEEPSPTPDASWLDDAIDRVK